MIRVLLVDDQKTVREALRMMLDAATDLEVVGTAGDGHTAIEQVGLLNPEVVLIDLEMPGLDGVSATQLITQQFPTVKVLVLSMHDDEALIAKSMQAGAMGYLMKNTPPQELRAAIRFVHRGYAQIGPGLLEKMVAGSTIETKTEAESLKELDPFTADNMVATNGVTTNGVATNGVASTGVGTNGAGTQGHFNSHTTDPRPGTSTSGAPLNGALTPASTPSSGLNGRALVESASHGPARTDNESLMARAISLEDYPNPAKTARWQRYFILGVLLNTTLWLGAFGFLKYKRPVYTSSWTLDLPAAKSDSMIEVPGVGRAAQTNDSPYSNIMVADPRANYKDLLEATEVLSAAAKTEEVPLNEFGEPKVEVVANTTLIKIAMNGLSPREAQSRAISLQKAFDQKLQELRKQETGQQNQNLKTALASAEDRLRVAQQRLSSYKVESGLDSGEQLRDRSINIETLRKEQAESVAQHKEVSDQINQMSANLGLSPQESADAFILQSDALFQQYLLGYSKTSSALASLESVYYKDHPNVVDKAEERDIARDRLFQRGQQLLGRPITETSLKQLNVSNSITSETQRSNLFEELIRLQGREEGLRAKANELSQQVAKAESGMTVLSKKRSILSNLEREVEIAEAIFTSIIGRLDLTKSSLSVAYPQFTMRTQPNLPKLPSSPKIIPLLLGTFLASSLISAGLACLWWRDRRNLRRKWLKRQQELASVSDRLPPSQLAPSKPISYLPGD
jgi:DNA-binding NarL/FixJ family response regulator/uncharacterized protein involved in exopolysaccharide biosynthesis